MGWNERLHPRGKGGKWVKKGRALAAKNRARREGNRPASAAAARQRRAGYGLVGVTYGLNVYGGLVGGQTFGKSRAGTIGARSTLVTSTIAHAHGVKSIREVTSKRHAALTPSQRKARVAQINRRQKSLNRAQTAVAIGALGAGYYGANPGRATAHRNHAQSTVRSFVKGNSRKNSGKRTGDAFGRSMGIRPTMRGRIDTMRMRARKR